jgi:hypothetical protein
MNVRTHTHSLHEWLEGKKIMFKYTPSIFAAYVRRVAQTHMLTFRKFMKLICHENAYEIKFYEAWETSEILNYAKNL